MAGNAHPAKHLRMEYDGIIQASGASFDGRTDDKTHRSLLGKAANVAATGFFAGLGAQL